MSKTLTVAWREFRDTAMTKAFVFGAIIMPVLTIGLFIIVIPLLESEDEPLNGTIAMLAPQDVASEFETLLKNPESPIQGQLDKLPEFVANDPIAKSILPQATKTNR